MDKHITSHQYISPKEWDKIPENLRNRIRAKETKLGATDVRTTPVKEDKQLTRMYAQARKYADWSKFTYMSSK